MNSDRLCVNKTSAHYQLLLYRRRLLRRERATLRKQQRERFAQFCQYYLSGTIYEDDTTLKDGSNSDDK